MISQFFPCAIQAELFEYRQPCNVISDTGLVPPKSLACQDATGTLIGVNQRIEFWGKSSSDSFSCFLKESSLSQAQPKQVRYSANGNDRKNPDQWIGLDNFDDIHVFALGMIMGLPGALWILFGATPKPLTPRVTGSRKWQSEAAPLLAVRVDAFVSSRVQCILSECNRLA